MKIKIERLLFILAIGAWLVGCACVGAYAGLSLTPSPNNATSNSIWNMFAVWTDSDDYMPNLEITSDQEGMLDYGQLGGTGGTWVSHTIGTIRQPIPVTYDDALTWWPQLSPPDGFAGFEPPPLDPDTNWSAILPGEEYQEPAYATIQPDPVSISGNGIESGSAGSGGDPIYDRLFDRGLDYCDDVISSVDGKSGVLLDDANMLDPTGPVPVPDDSNGLIRIQKDPADPTAGYYTDMWVDAYKDKVDIGTPPDDSHEVDVKNNPCILLKYSPVALVGVWSDASRTAAYRVKAKLTPVYLANTAVTDAGGVARYWWNVDLPKTAPLKYNVIEITDTRAANGLRARWPRLYISCYFPGSQYVMTQHNPLPLPYTVYTVNLAYKDDTYLNINDSILHFDPGRLSNPSSAATNDDCTLMGVYSTNQLDQSATDPTNYYDISQFEPGVMRYQLTNGFGKLYFPKALPAALNNAGQTFYVKVSTNAVDGVWTTTQPAPDDYNYYTRDGTNNLARDNIRGYCGHGGIIRLGTPLPGGDIVTYNYTVRNTSLVPLSSVSLADTVLGPVSLGQSVLMPGESTTGTASMSLTETLLNQGSQTNTAIATGTPSAVDRDSQTIELGARPAIDVVKTFAWTRGNGAHVGDQVTFTYNVKNAGLVTLDGITVNDVVTGGDPAGLPIALPATRLAPGASTTGTMRVTLTAGMLAAGSQTDTATATGASPSGAPATDTDSQTIQFGNPPSIDVVKNFAWTMGNGTHLGDVVTFTYTVRNTGSATLNPVTVVDDKLGDITLAATSLAPGASTTGTKSLTVTQDLFDNGGQTNTATATGTLAGGGTVTDTAVQMIMVGRPSIDIEKTLEWTTGNGTQVGDVVTYTYTVTNTGKTILDPVTVHDDVLGDIPLDSTSLAPGQSTTGTYALTTTEALFNGAPQTNTATATGTPPVGAPVTDVDSQTVKFDGGPSVDIVKTVAWTQGDGMNVGDVATYTYTVRNTGQVILNPVTVTDDVLGPITLEASVLAPGATTTGTATLTITQSMLDAAAVTNTATVIGVLADPVTDKDQQTVTFGAAPSIDVSKTFAWTTGNGTQPGDVLTYTYTVTNTGPVELDSVTVSDDQLGPVALGAATLAPGASTTGTATLVLNQTLLNARWVTNTATAGGTPADGSPAVSDTDKQTVVFGDDPSIDVVKTFAWTQGDGSHLLDPADMDADSHTWLTGKRAYPRYRYLSSGTYTIGRTPNLGYVTNVDSLRPAASYCANSDQCAIVYDPVKTVIGTGGKFAITAAMPPFGTYAARATYYRSCAKPTVWLNGSIPMNYIQYSARQGAEFRVSVSAGLNMSNPKQQPNRDRDLNLPALNNKLLYDRFSYPMYLLSGLVPNGINPATRVPELHWLDGQEGTACGVPHRQYPGDGPQQQPGDADDGLRRRRNP